jgi:hypothetical protein
MSSLSYKHKGRRQSRKRQNKDSAVPAKLQQMSIVHLNKYNSPAHKIFLDRLYAWLKTDNTSRFTGAPSWSETYKLNGAAAVVPQINYSGAFSGNYPAGLTYLLGSNVSSGANAPYYFARIVESTIHVEILPDPYVAFGATAPFTATVLPTYNASLSGVSATQMRELEYAKSKLIGSTVSGKSFVFNHAMSPATMLGQTMKGYLTEESSLFTYNTDPTNLAYWQVALRSEDGTSNISGVMTVQVQHKFEFVLSLNMKTSPPSFESLQQQLDQLRLSSVKSVVEPSNDVSTPQTATTSLSLSSLSNYILVKKP